MRSNRQNVNLTEGLSFQDTEPQASTLGSPTDMETTLSKVDDQFDEVVNFDVKLKANEILASTFSSVKPSVVTSSEVKSNELMFQRLGFDRSPEMRVGATKLKQKVVKDWHLSYNEANLTNYTQFGVKSKSLHQRNTAHQANNTHTFFNKRLQMR